MHFCLFSVLNLGFNHISDLSPLSEIRSKCSVSVDTNFAAFATFTVDNVCVIVLILCVCLPAA